MTTWQSLLYAACMTALSLGTAHLLDTTNDGAVLMILFFLLSKAITEPRQ